MGVLFFGVIVGDSLGGLFWWWELVRFFKVRDLIIDYLDVCIEFWKL